MAIASESMGVVTETRHCAITVTCSIAASLSLPATSHVSQRPLYSGITAEQMWYDTVSDYSVNYWVTQSTTLIITHSYLYMNC